MTRRILIGFTFALFVLPANLSAQADPIEECQSRASVLVNADPGVISAWWRGGVDNGDYIILWTARLANGRALNGFCEANPRTGRIVRLGTSQADASINRSYRLTPEDAEQVCVREARARFGPGNGEIGAIFQEHVSTKATYWVEWRYDNLARTVRKGRCEIDSATGRIRKFEAKTGW